MLRPTAHFLIVFREHESIMGKCKVRIPAVPGGKILGICIPVVPEQQFPAKVFSA